jgi:uncharacterized protein with GYD domain
MSQFLVRFSYTPKPIRGMIDQPEIDRAAQASAMAGSLGAKLLGYWFAFGEFDGVALMEAPENSSAAAVTMAIRSTGDVSRIETTVLLTMDEAREAMRRAGAATNLPPGKEAGR